MTRRRTRTAAGSCSERPIYENEWVTVGLADISQPIVGMVRSAHCVYLARGAELVAEPSKANEGAFEWVASADVPELIAKGRIVDSGSLVRLLHVLAFDGPAGAPSRPE